VVLNVDDGSYEAHLPYRILDFRMHLVVNLKKIDSYFDYDGKHLVAIVVVALGFIDTVVQRSIHITTIKG
jgi:hypothetical protein